MCVVEDSFFLLFQLKFGKKFPVDDQRTNIEVNIYSIAKVTVAETRTENSLIKNGKGLGNHSLQGIVINLMQVH